MGGPELLPGILAAAFAAQPLTVDEMGAGEVGGHPTVAEPLDGLAVVGFGVRPGADQRPRARRHPECPLGAAGAGSRGQLLHRRSGTLRLAGADGRFNQLGQSNAAVRQFVVLARWHRSRQRGVVVTQPVMQISERHFGTAYGEALTSPRRIFNHRCVKRRCLGLPAAPGSQ